MNTDTECSIKLDNTWGGCPEYWRNFVRSLGLPDDDSDRERTHSINTALVEYNAIRYDDTRVVVFSAPMYKTWFVLRWAS